MSNRQLRKRVPVPGFVHHPWFNTVVLLIALVLIWEAAAFQSDPNRFPSLLEVGAGLYAIATGSAQFSFLTHAYATLIRIVASVSLSLLIGVPLGIMMGRSALTEDVFFIHVMLSMSVPAFVWAFLGVLWFGMTEYLVTVMVGIIVLVPYVVFNVWQGTKNIDENLLEMGTVFKLKNRSVWRNIFIPHLTPYILSSTRMIVAIGWKIMLVAELFGANSGLGHVISEYFFNHQNDMILAWSIPFIILIFLFERVLRRLEMGLFEWRAEGDNYVMA